MPEILASSKEIEVSLLFECKLCFCQWKAKKEEVDDFGYNYTLSLHSGFMKCPECGEKTPLRSLTRFPMKV